MSNDRYDSLHFEAAAYARANAAEAEIERLRGMLARLKGTGDRLRDAANAALDMTKEWHGGLCSCRKCKVRDELGLSINAYDTQRAAVGEIGEE